MTNPPHSTLPSEEDDSDALTRLALDLSWSWNHSSDEIWKRLDPELWELTGNPWLILQSLSRRKLASLTDDAFRAQVERLMAEASERNAAPAWFRQRIHRLRFAR